MRYDKRFIWFYLLLGCGEHSVPDFAFGDGRGDFVLFATLDIDVRRGGFAAGVAVGVVGLEIEAEREHLDGLVPLHVEVEFSGLFPYFDEFCQHGFVLVPDFAEQFECLDGLALAYDADGVERAVNEESRFEQRLRVFANLYVGAVLLGCTFQARGEVHGVAHHGVVLAHGRAHVARDDVARVDTDAHVHFVDGCGPLVTLVFPLLAQFA